MGERNNGGEVGDEGEPLKPAVPNMRQWREGDIDGQGQIVKHPAGNGEARNQMYVDQADYENRKEEEDGKIS